MSPIRFFDSFSITVLSSQFPQLLAKFRWLDASKQGNFKFSSRRSSKWLCPAPLRHRRLWRRSRPSPWKRPTAPSLALWLLKASRATWKSRERRQQHRRSLRHKAEQATELHLPLRSCLCHCSSSSPCGELVDFSGPRIFLLDVDLVEV